MRKQKFNLHTHTWRCGHASGKDYEYIENAIKAGFKIIGFSEHIQYRNNKGKYGRIDFEDYKYYFQDISLLKDKYKNDISVLCGLEAEYVPLSINDLIELSRNCDYILLGQHQGGECGKKYCLKCGDDDVLQYAKDIEVALTTGLFSILAHPDFFMSTRNTWSKKCIEASERICIAAKNHDIPLEINIKGCRSQKDIIDKMYCFHYPYRKFWEIAEKVGNKVLYGWDAHSPNELLCSTTEAEKIIQGLNLNWVDYKDLNYYYSGN